MYCYALHNSSTEFFPRIVNETKTTMQLKSSSDIYCSISDTSEEDVHLYRVIWRDRLGNKIGKNMNRAYSVVGLHPRAYLIFNKFQKESAGDYTCEVWKDNRKIYSSKITVEPPWKNDTQAALAATSRHTSMRRQRQKSQFGLWTSHYNQRYYFIISVTHSCYICSSRSLICLWDFFNSIENS